MKVTIVVGGRWHAFNLAEKLEEEECLHRLITSYPHWYVRKWKIPKDKIKSLPLQFYLTKLSYKIGGNWLIMKLQWPLHQLFAQRAKNYLTGSELIHCWAQFAKPSLEWAKLHNIPTVLERSSSHILEQKEVLGKAAERNKVKMAKTSTKIEQMELEEYELCDSIAVPSSYVEETFIRRGIAKEKLFKNYLGVEIENFRRNQTTKRLKRETLRAVYAGSISIRKGIPDLIEAFNILKKYDIHLTMIGGMSSELKHIMKRKTQNVDWIGHVKQESLIKYYQDSDIFVIASIEEGMAMVQMQALSCGLPIICTANTGGEDLLYMNDNKPISRGMNIKEYNAGYVTPINSPQAIAWCIKELKNNKTLLEEKSENAYMLARNKLDWTNYGLRSISNYMQQMRKKSE